MRTFTHFLRLDGPRILVPSYPAATWWCLLEEYKKNWVLLGDDVTVFRMQRYAWYVVHVCVSLRSGRIPRFSKWKWTSDLEVDSRPLSLVFFTLQVLVSASPCGWQSLVRCCAPVKHRTMDSSGRRILRERRTRQS